MVGGCCLPLSGNDVVGRYQQGTPWNGLCGRDDDEGENQEIAGRLVEYLLPRYREVSLTLPPQWTDLRPFIWAGMRQHVRYTYRGPSIKMLDRYEKRLRLRHVAREEWAVSYFDLPAVNSWKIVEWRIHDSRLLVVQDGPVFYYWDANPGGSWHSELAHKMIVMNACSDGGICDMVGANGPGISLFKRQFGGYLTPYYAVTTSEEKDLRAHTYTRRENLRAVSAGA